MRGDVIVVAVGLVVALAFSTLVKAFTDPMINPPVAGASERDSESRRRRIHCRGRGRSR
jgi:large conductance mechanosensitive channel